MATDAAQAAVPKEFFCGPYRYRVGFDGEASYDYHFLGVALYNSKQIKLCPRQADTELPQTFLHEALHALGQAYEIREWDRHTTNDKHEITDKIDIMATAILQFIRSNPEVVKWLQETR